jgi:hypothetical protein
VVKFATTVLGGQYSIDLLPPGVNTTYPFAPQPEFLSLFEK